MRTTVGQIMVNAGLPEEYQDYGRSLDKKSIRQLLERVAKERPDDYSQILKHLMDVGRSAASTKGASVSLKHLVAGRAKRKIVNELRALNQADIDNPELTDEQRDKRIIARTAKYYDRLSDAVMEEAKASGSPFAQQVASGGRGNPGQHTSLVGADLLVSDYKNRPMPVPIYSNYSEGLDPVEYWASAYGARKGLVDVKMATADAGFFGKQLALAAHRQVVTDDEPIKTRLPVGLVVSADDPDNEGAVLAMDAGPYKAGETITPKMLEDIRRTKDKILIHSPLTSLAENGGLDRLSAGVRSAGTIANLGDNVGIAAAQAISEPISQGSLDSKHRSGVGGERIRRQGFEYLNRLFQSPEFFAEAGPIAPSEGRVSYVQEAPQGGHFIGLGDQKIYVHPGVSPTVKPGQKVEVGDSLTDGVPHPRELVKYLGVGEARRRFLNHAMEAFDNSNLNINRRNAEAVVAGVINHMRVTNPDGVGDHIVDDIVPYNRLAATYKPRENSRLTPLDRARDQYLEEPVLHYSPGTRLTRRVLDELKEFGVEDVQAHPEAPDFEPHFERLMTVTSLDPDWQTQLGGFYVSRSFPKAVQRGAVSTTDSTSYIPALAQGANFGKTLEQSGRY